MAIFIPAAFVIGIYLVPLLIDRILHLHEGETRTAIVIGVALVYAWAAEHWGGLAAITGAYIAGLMIARTDIGEHATESMNKIAYAFFIPIFFVVVGLKMDSSALRDAPLFAAALIAVAVVTKIIGAMGGALAGGFSMRDATRVGYGMVSRGEVALVVAVVGLNRGLIDDREFSATILMTLATTLIAPLLLKWAYRRDARQQAFEPAPAHGTAKGLSSAALAKAVDV
jgi:Kef-type K+ transport system membrane component KefB